ncbi:hypothetical protein J3R73_002001 [Labrys monachus]|uniref:Dmrt1 n=1 Tax=Labrys monachus TaxID=217067 RepID=A0ABU0FC68_9HYPH|nr:hypothetical protein [Labrys monachus]
MNEMTPALSASAISPPCNRNKEPPEEDQSSGKAF